MKNGELTKKWVSKWVSALFDVRNHFVLTINKNLNLKGIKKPSKIN